ncbi:META domain-containing protein [Lentzea sp. NPDC006480]|uniref:META domain-containing protein n=1 Tax=Lentzea sp. NPDC006480 TaxID=3157176 RepID=UPI0033BE3865
MFRPLHMSYRVLVAAIAVALLATGCGNRSAGQGESDVQGKVFTSTSVTDQGKPRAMVEGTRVELRFTDDGRLLAHAGCNQMQGPVTLDGGKLQVTDLGMTAMGCPNPDLHTQDQWLSKLLSAGPAWKLDGSTLVITGSGAEIVLTAEAPAKLEGGIWKLESLIQADAVSSVPGRVPATLKFENGNVSVFTGCNDGSASYKVDGQTITFESLVHTDKACGADETSVEKAVVAVLSGQVTYKIDRKSLTLTNAKGEGVQLKS